MWEIGVKEFSHILLRTSGNGRSDPFWCPGVELFLAAIWVTSVKFRRVWRGWQGSWASLESIDLYSYTHYIEMELRTSMNPIRAYDKDELVDRFEDVHEELKPVAVLYIDVDDSEFSEENVYEMKMDTSGYDGLTPEIMDVLSDHGLGATNLGGGSWLLMEDDDD